MVKKLQGFQKGNTLGKIHKGRKFSVDSREKMSQSHKGKKHSKETKEKMSVAHKKNIVRYWLGKKKPHSEKTKQKISISSIGKKCPWAVPPHPKKEKHPNWQGGKSFELYGFDWTNPLKHSIRIRDCFICKICRKNGWVVHHIDYNKKNNNPNNLITLCNSCHMKTNFNREKWIKYFNEQGKIYNSRYATSK